MHSIITGIMTESEEGPLEWKTIEWIRHSNDAVSNIPIFLDHLLSDDQPVEYAFLYVGEKIAHYTFNH